MVDERDVCVRMTAAAVTCGVEQVYEKACYREVLEP
jgi:hypothetical protein